MLDGVKGEGRTEGGGAQASDHAVKPVGPREPTQTALKEHERGDVGEWVEGQVEEVSPGRVRRVRAAERFGGEHKVADCPRQQSEAQEQGDGSTGSMIEAAIETHTNGHQLHAGERPAIEPRPLLIGVANDQRDDVGEEQRPENGVTEPDAVTPCLKGGDLARR